MATIYGKENYLKIIKEKKLADLESQKSKLLEKIKKDTTEEESNDNNKSTTNTQESGKDGTSEPTPTTTGAATEKK
jgi:hypothetical protein